MPFDPNPTDAAALRESIQLAAATDTIALTENVIYDSITTLAKIVCGLPTVRETGYIIMGENSTIRDSRLFQQNIDGDLPPGQVKGGTSDLTLLYSSGGASDGGALLRANFADYTIDNVTFTGVHSGCTGNGNGGLYMSLTTFNYAAPIDVDLTFSNSLIEVTGQGNFDGTLSSGEGGSAFLHSWNNAGTVTLDTNIFDEAGYRSSFNFTNFGVPASGPPTVGTYNIIGNTFTRTANETVVRSEGNRLGNVKATLTNNIFEKGAYLDLYGDLTGVSFEGGENVFRSIAGGYGIRATAPNVGIVTLAAEASLDFSGDGIALKYVSATAGAFVLSTAGVSGAGITINGKGYKVAAAGGQVADTINTINELSLWADGDSGNDTITGSSNDDYLNGGADEDVLTAGAGADTVLGEGGNDTLSGDNDADFMNGGANNDSISGGAGADTLQGGTGDDILQGGTGVDTLTGGDGADQFKWASGDSGDIVTDFIVNDGDQSALANVFNNTTGPGTLNALDFKTASAINGTQMTNANNSNRVTRITAGITNAASGTAAGVVNAYVLAFNGTGAAARGVLYWDDNWGNTSNLLLVATYANIQSLNDLNAFSNANFFAYT
jgi:Ca2+-binding RTX toxin-like protein